MEKNKTREYLKYAIGEVFLVVIGILIALQINNWNENRLKLTLEKEMLIEIKTGLRSDLKDVLFNLKSETKRIASGKILIDWIERDLPYNDSLGVHFQGVSNATFFNVNVGAYQTLKQMGSRIIRNDSLRGRISTLYENEYVFYNVINRVHIKDCDKLNSNNALYFTERSLNGKKMTLIDIKGLKANTEYLFHLKTMRNSGVLKTRTIIPELITEIKEIIVMIEEELN